MKPRLTIQTPEGIVFPLQPASPMARFLALVVDQVCIQAASSIVAVAAGLVRAISVDIAGAVWMIAWFLISVGYPILFEWRLRGQTIGKRLLRLRVMDAQALRLTFSQVVVRNVLRFVDAIPGFYMVGGLACVFTARGQRVGDIAANTVVVFQPKRWEPDLAQVLPEKFNSFRQYPQLAARLRHALSPAEAGLFVQALLLRDSLEPTARVPLFEAMKAHVQRAVPFPPEATENLSAEQYVRNVVELLFRRA